MSSVTDSESEYRHYGLRILITLLVVVYTLTNAGRFHIIDEVSLFALTESVAQRGALDTNAIAWTQWVNSPGEVLGEFGADGQVFSKKGPAPALLAVPWHRFLQFLAQLEIEVGLVQAGLLWNGLITACTAALLWLTAGRLGYGDRIGAGLGLLFGLCTIAWPYANHFFGEPLSAFNLLLCFYALLAWRQTGRMRWMGLAGAAAGLVIVTVTAHVILVAILGLYWLEALGKRRGAGNDSSIRNSLYALLAFALPVTLCAAFLLWYNLVRFGDPLSTGYHFESGEGFTTPIGQGLWGLLISPYRGVFWHTPLFFATLFAFIPFLRRHWAEGTLIAVLSMVLISLYSTWWMWWGGFAWGPRFLVPLTPFWVLVLAPQVERLGIGKWGLTMRLQSPIPTSQSPGVTSVLFSLLALLSLVVQVSAVVVNYVNYEIELRRIFPTLEHDPLAFGPPAQRLADWRYSPVLGQWWLMRQGVTTNSDLAWLQPDGTVHWVTLLVGVAALMTLGMALGGWWGAGGSCSALPSRFIRWSLPLLAALVIAVWIGDSSRDPVYGLPDQGYRAILAEVCSEAQPGDAMITIAPYKYHIPMNWMGGRCQQSIPLFGYATDSIAHAETERVLSRLLQVYRRIWFVTDGLPANDAANTVERWLAEVAYKADDRWFAEYRLVRYATPLNMSNAQRNSLDLFLTDPDSHLVTLSAARAPGEGRPGEILPVEINYQLDAPVTVHLRWFVQLLTPEGAAVALLDTAPSQGYAAFPTLPTGEPLVEKAALQLPNTLPPGRYRLIAGLYNPDAPDPKRLSLPNGQDHVELGVVHVR